MIENVTELETKFGIAEGTLQAAIDSAESTKIEIPVGTLVNTETHEVFLKDDYLKRTENLKEENKLAGVEIAVKGVRTDMGLEFEGKTMDNLMTAYKEKVLKEANIEPDKKSAEYDTTITGLRTNLTDLQTKFNDLEANGLKKDSQREIDGNILSKLGGNYTLAKEDVMTLFKTRYDVVVEDGKTLIKQNGETMKDKVTYEPLSLEVVMGSFTESYTKKSGGEGGAGAGDTLGNSKPGSIEAFYKEMETSGKTQEEANVEMQVRMKAGTLVL